MTYRGFARHRRAPRFIVRLRLQERLLAGETRCRLNVGKFTAAQKRGVANVNDVAYVGRYSRPNR